MAGFIQSQKYTAHFVDREGKEFSHTFDNCPAAVIVIRDGVDIEEYRYADRWDGDHFKYVFVGRLADVPDAYESGAAPVFAGRRVAVTMFFVDKLRVDQAQMIDPPRLYRASFMNAHGGEHFSLMLREAPTKLLMVSLSGGGASRQFPYRLDMDEFEHGSYVYVPAVHAGGFDWSRVEYHGDRLVYFAANQPGMRMQRPKAAPAAKKEASKVGYPVQFSVGRYATKIPMGMVIFGHEPGNRIIAHTEAQTFFFIKQNVELTNGANVRTYELQDKCPFKNLPEHNYNVEVINDVRYLLEPVNMKRAGKMVQLRGGEHMGVADCDVLLGDPPNDLLIQRTDEPSVCALFTAHQHIGDDKVAYRYVENVPTPRILQQSTLPEPRTYTVIVTQPGTGETLKLQVAKQPGAEFMMNLFGRKMVFEFVQQSGRVYEYKIQDSGEL